MSAPGSARRRRRQGRAPGVSVAQGAGAARAVQRCWSTPASVTTETARRSPCSPRWTPTSSSAGPAAGVAPEDVDVVVSTHNHGDHVGWNTRRDGNRRVPTFSDATYVLPSPDVEHFHPRQRR